jgi:hypothetical protein
MSTALLIDPRPEHRAVAGSDQFDQVLKNSWTSSKNRSQAGSCSRNRWFFPGSAINRAPGIPAAI